jgi:hypothetical protein
VIPGPSEWTSNGKVFTVKSLWQSSSNAKWLDITQNVTELFTRHVHTNKGFK